MRKNNETGSALFTVMIAAALGLVVAITLTRLTSATGLLAKSAQLEGDLDRLDREIKGTLADAKNCPGMFRDAADATIVANPAAMATPVTVNRLYSGFNTGGRAIAKLNGTTAGLVITSMDLREPYKIQSNLTAGQETWEMALRLTLEKKLDATTALPGSSVVIRKYRISATLDSTNHIVACAPLGSRTALGPMSPIRSTTAQTAANCSTPAEKDTMCSSVAPVGLTPAARAGLPANPTQYFAATQGDVLAFGMLEATATIGVAPAGAPAFGLYDVNNPLFGHGGASSWALYDRLTVVAQCTVLCIHKDAPIRFTRTGIAANAGTTGVGGKDAKCKTDIGPKYVAATFNDLAQAGWTSTSSDPGTAVVAQFSATIGTYAGQVRFGAAGIGTTRVMYYDGTSTGTAYPLACVRRAKF